MLSFWERESFLTYDHIIIGSGIVGLSTAASLIEKNPKAKILVLERGIFPSGASTRNAGFACFGSLTELIADISKSNTDEMLELVRMRWEGLGKLRGRLGDQKIDYKQTGGYELLFGDTGKITSQIDKVNMWLQPLFNEPVFRERNELIKQFGFNSRQVSTLIENPLEGQIDTGKMMKALIEYVTSKGVSIITGARVEKFEEEEDFVRVQVQSSVGQEKIGFKAASLAICTNAFTQKLLPDIDVVPGRGQVLITRPIPNLKFEGVFHYEEGFFYFRNVGNRVLFGGGRNRDLEGERTDEFGNNPKIRSLLYGHLREVILPRTDFEIDMEWSGIMAFGAERKPILKKHSDRVFIGVRMNGMGVAIGSEIGERLAEMMAN
jgi:glycine/D-amino acid oxidase-like deaminating enzyme